MTGMNRYWDCERCAWVAYESAAAVPEALVAAVPEQRDDEPAPAPAQATVTAD